MREMSELEHVKKVLKDKADQMREYELQIEQAQIESFSKYFHGNVDLKTEFLNSSEKVQRTFLKTNIHIFPENYYPYLLMLQRISDTDLDIIGRPNKSIEHFFEICGTYLSTLQPDDPTVTHTEDYPYRIIVEFSLKRGPFGDSSYLITWLMLAVFETDTIDEYLARRPGEAPESSICDMIDVLSDWGNVKKYPLSWAIELIRSEKATL